MNARSMARGVGIACLVLLGLLVVALEAQIFMDLAADYRASIVRDTVAALQHSQRVQQ